ncbi:MAG: 4-hydroxythreonine-4-phosphate dehydrogenase [Nitratiruptor sp.]|nr:4-hydroxythreonine-4-phosphate dehydrogenase [Nitratiruptor sp.]NPA83230.1 4-hydroxythreonine-4-phosphate dehydrogenase [Campylobacterota bacterium]
MDEAPLLAVSIGDLNGIAPHIAFLAHEEATTFCRPLYFTNAAMIEKAAKLLNHPIPDDFEIEHVSGEFTIKPGHISKKSGRYSFASFAKAVEFTTAGITQALVTLPIHKEAWHRAKIPYTGHTDYLRHRFKRQGIMALGTKELLVALYTDHIPLKEVASKIRKKPLKAFLLRLHRALTDLPLAQGPIAVLGLNPHGGDGGVLGKEEKKIAKAIAEANEEIGFQRFVGPLVPDSAFAPHMRSRYQLYVALYHDQGLAPLKALYFDESINLSLGFPIIRTSVDHGTAFDIAYKEKPKVTSYLNALRFAAELARRFEPSA